MKVLLVNSNRELTPFPVLPLGPCLVASAVADRGGHEVAFLDLTFSPGPAADVRARVEAFRPDVVGLTVRNLDNVDYLSPLFYLDGVREAVVEPIRAASDAPIVLGGAGFSVEPEGTLRFFGLTLGVVGDGEEAFPALLDQLGGDEPRFDTVPGLAWIDEQGAFHETPRAPAPDLDALPFSRPWRWLDVEQYGRYGGALGVQTKRGCALRCVYCVYNSIEGRAYRLRSADSVAGELAEMARETKVRHCEFTDSTFNAPLSPAKALLEKLAGLGLPLRYQTSGVNPGFVDREFADLLVRAGFRSIMVTAEAASDPVLEGMQKGYARDQVERTVRLVRDLPLKVFWFFLFGGPGETAETVEETLAFIRDEIPPSHLVYFGAGLRIQRNAPIESLAREQGLLGSGDDLLRPRYYFSPGLDRDALLARLGREVLAHTNYIQTVDYQGGRGPVMLARLFSFLGLTRPSWSFVPTLFKLFPFMRRKDRFERK